jgi:hypothetical protein
MYRRSGSTYRGRVHVAVLVIMCALLGACASGGARSLAEPAMANGTAETSDVCTHVVVNNLSGQRVTVYITQGSVAWRLGIVESYSRRALPLQIVAKAMLDIPTMLIGRPADGPPYRSEVFSMNAHNGIPVWTIESSPAYSHVAVGGARPADASGVQKVDDAIVAELPMASAPAAVASGP